MDLPIQLAAWHDRGTFLDWEGHQIFTVDVGPSDDHAVFILHGFPTSSLDWHEVVARIDEDVRVVTFDMLGFGLSDKPMDKPYSLFRQADLAEFVAKRLGVTSCLLVGHDMGQTVAAELLARRADGDLDLVVRDVIITNGSTLIDLANLSPIQQQWLEAPDAPRDEPEDLEALRPLLPFTFGPDHPPDEDTMDGMLASIQHNGGDLLLPRLVRYVLERRKHLDHWTAALTEHDLPMTIAWGELDFIAVVAMAHRFKELVPTAELVLWDDVGHWPPIEVPDRFAELILQHA